jgi:histone deacetylase complex regulatory component SIN3
MSGDGSEQVTNNDSVLGHAADATDATLRPQTDSPVLPPAAVTDASNDGRPTHDVRGALMFLDRVKGTFEYEPRVYDDFLDLMKDFKVKM